MTSRIRFFGAIAVALVQTKVLAHAPAAIRVHFPIHRVYAASHVTTQFANILATSHQSSTAGRLAIAFSGVPVSRTSKAYASSVRNIIEATIKNTVEKAPLNNISGQLVGVDYYSYSSGVSGVFNIDYPNVIAFGYSNPLNNGYVGSISHTVASLNNSISTGLPIIKTPINIFPSSINGHVFSGAQRQLQSYYSAAARSAYNAGATALEHPTGGLLFGTNYYSNGTASFARYSGLEAFGNNSLASESTIETLLNQSRGLILSHPLASYIQFGKFTRPISNGFLTGTISYRTPPPYGAGSPGTYFSEGYYNVAIGSNPLNVGTHATGVSLPLQSKTFLK
jgi:hypothetical protein